MFIKTIKSFKPVDSTAVNANKDAVGDTGPCRVLCSTVKTDFIALSRPQSLEYLHDIRLRRPRHCVSLLEFRIILKSRIELSVTHLPPLQLFTKLLLAVCTQSVGAVQLSTRHSTRFCFMIWFGFNKEGEEDERRGGLVDIQDTRYR